MRLTPRGKKRSRRGSTLIEAMVALSVTGLAIATFATAFPFAGNSISRSRQSEIATNGCQLQLEYWRDIGYASLPVPADTRSVSRSFSPPAGLNSATGTVTFTRVTDAMVPTTSDTGSIRVDATIHWSGTGRDGGDVTLTSLVVQ
jgi:type II secretory pathway pseudopilin PulG